MRRLVAIMALTLASILVIDIAAPVFIRLEPGSVGIKPQAADLELLPFHPDWDDPECAQPEWTEDESCMRRYAFHAGATLTVWFSVRNAGPVPISLLGASDEWIGQFADVVPLARPTGGLDGGGDPHVAVTLAEIVAKPFEPVTVWPNDERLLGIAFTRHRSRGA